MQDGVNRENLVKIKRVSYHDPNIIIATVNIQSLRNKELQVSELFGDHAVDVLVVTETWLTNKESDKNWLDAMDLNKDKTALYVHNRSNGRGGGLALMFKSCYKVKTPKKGNTSSFKYATWELMIKSRHITVTGIYHPLYSTKNRITNKMFIDDFTEFSTNLLTDYRNNIVLGDFNLHISNDDDTEAAIFTDTCEAIGLYQYILFPIHKSGNVLDLILTKVANNTKVLRTHRGPFISDHALVLAQLNIKQQTRSRQTEMICVIRHYV